MSIDSNVLQEMRRKELVSQAMGLIGSIKTEKKARASAENGKRYCGRPRTAKPDKVDKGPRVFSEQTKERMRVSQQARREREKVSQEAVVDALMTR